jgi:hypothetical protein
VKQNYDFNKDSDESLQNLVPKSNIDHNSCFEKYKTKPINENEIKKPLADQNYLTVNWPAGSKIKNNNNKIKLSNGNGNNGKKKSNWINFKIFKKHKPNSKINLKKITKHQWQHGKRFYIVDTIDNNNIYYVYNPNIPRRLSVITEERASGLSSRSNSTDKTHTIM